MSRLIEFEEYGIHSNHVLRVGIYHATRVHGDKLVHDIMSYDTITPIFIGKSIRTK